MGVLMKLDRTDELVWRKHTNIVSGNMYHVPGIVVVVVVVLTLTL